MTMTIYDALQQAALNSRKADDLLAAIWELKNTPEVPMLLHRAISAEAYRNIAAPDPEPPAVNSELLQVAKRARAELAAMHGRLRDPTYIYPSCDGGCPADDILRALAAAITRAEAALCNRRDGGTA